MRIRSNLVVAAFVVCILVGNSMCVAHAETLIDDFSANHIYWDGSTADVSGTIWAGIQGTGYITDSNANIGATSELQFAHDAIACDGTYSPFDAPGLYLEMTGDFDAKLRMDVLAPDEPYIAQSLAAWSADQQYSVRVDNIAVTGQHVRFRNLCDQADFKEYKLSIPRQTWFRLKRTGNDYEGFYSSDGSSWTKIGNTITGDYGDTLRVGPATFNPMGTAYTGSFSYFEIDGTPVPEPGSIVLLISVMLGSIFARRRF